MYKAVYLCVLYSSVSLTCTSLYLKQCATLFTFLLNCVCFHLMSLAVRKSSTVPDSVAMTTLARKRPSSVIQVTVKQTETDPGLIGVVREGLNINTWQCEDTVLCLKCNPNLLNCPPYRTAQSQMR